MNWISTKQNVEQTFIIFLEQLKNIPQKCPI